MLGIAQGLLHRDVSLCPPPSRSSPYSPAHPLHLPHSPSPFLPSHIPLRCSHPPLQHRLQHRLTRRWRRWSRSTHATPFYLRPSRSLSGQRYPRADCAGGAGGGNSQRERRRDGAGGWVGGGGRGEGVFKPRGGVKATLTHTCLIPLVAVFSRISASERMPSIESWLVR